MVTLWSITVEEKPLLVETWSRYDVALVEAFQVKVGGLVTPVALFAGEDKLGTEGSAAVVKLKTEDHAPVPPGPVAFTRQ